MRAITELLSGHNTLRRHLHVMGLTEDPASGLCEGEDVSSLHLLYHALVRQRFQTCWVGLTTLKEIKEASLWEILSFARGIGLT